jgi:hypothetical protein
MNQIISKQELEKIITEHFAKENKKAINIFFVIGESAGDYYGDPEYFFKEVQLQLLEK